MVLVVHPSHLFQLGPCTYCNSVLGFLTSFNLFVFPPAKYNFKMCCFFEVAFVPARKSSEHPTNVITIVQFCQQWPFAEQPLYLWKSKHLNWPVHSQKTSQWLISGNCCLKTVLSSSFSLQAGRLKAIQISQSLVFSWCVTVFILPEAGIGANKSLKNTLTLCKLQWSN